MEMPIGQYKGQPLDAVPVGYLLWLVSREAIRHSRWPLIEEVLRELRNRFAQWDDLIAALRISEPPPEYWKTPKRAAQKAAERAEKLRQLEEQRRQALHEDTRKRLAWQLAQRHKVPSGTMTADQILDAWRAGDLPGQTENSSVADDLSDLV